MEIKDDNHATLTFTTCPSWEAIAKEGVGREDEICKVVDLGIYNTYAHAINPDIQVKLLKTPGEDRKQNGYCTWDFRLEKKGQ